MLRLLRNATPLPLLLATAAGAHPFLDVQPFPPASIASGSAYNLVMELFPGDTPVVSVQVDFELSSAAAFSPPTGALGEGFTLVYDGVADPLHFSIVADFGDDPLEAFGEFPVASLTMTAGLSGETLSMLDSSVIVAIEGGVPEEFERDHFSNVFDPVVAEVVPEASSSLLLGSGLAGLVGLARRRRR